MPKVNSSTNLYVEVLLDLQFIPEKKKMACSPLNKKSHFHARSNSLPSRPHPIVSQIDEHLCKLKATETTSSSISSSINGLSDLHDLVNNLLLLPHTQETLTQDCNEELIDEVLDRSLRLMDACSTSKDALLQIKEETQELQSVLRRRRGDESWLANEVGEYWSSRKKANKAIHKSLRDLKSRCTLDNEAMATTIGLLREVEEVTITVIESLISYTKAKSKPRGWSLVSKLMYSKRVSCKDNVAETNEFTKVDAELYSLIHHKTGKSSSTIAENALNLLGNLELSIQDLEVGLEYLQRRLIKTRVSLLNIINH